MASASMLRVCDDTGVHRAVEVGAELSQSDNSIFVRSCPDLGARWLDAAVLPLFP
jgi:hypothetical protein